MTPDTGAARGRPAHVRRAPSRSADAGVLRDPRELAALLAITRAVTSSFGLDEVLRRSLDTFIEETSADAAEAWLLEGSTLVLTMHRGDDPGAFGSVDRLDLGQGLPGRAAEGRDPIVVHDLPADDRFVRREIIEAGYVTFCAIPLWYRGRLVGVMAAAARDAGAMTDTWELRLLGAVGEWLALAVEHARLHRQVQDDAVLQEREWIARELHDGLGQVVGNIIARMLTVKKLLADGRLDELRTELDVIEGISRAVYADVREAMLGLRTTPRTEDGLVEAVRTFVESFTDATGIATTVVPPAPDVHVHVSPDIEIQVVRILQEALSNVRKHSGAAAVRVVVDHDGPFLRTSVIDDGRGFDPSRPKASGWPRFGLQTMQERATSIGGELIIESRPGQGTSVVVRVPLDARGHPTDAH